MIDPCLTLAGGAFLVAAAGWDFVSTFAFGFLFSFGLLSFSSSPSDAVYSSISRTVSAGEIRKLVEIEKGDTQNTH